MPVYVVHTGADEKIKFAVKRKAEISGSVNHEKSSPAKMKFGVASSAGTTSGISIKVGQLVGFNSIMLYKVIFILIIREFVLDKPC